MATFSSLNPSPTSSSYNRQSSSVTNDTGSISYYSQNSNSGRVRMRGKWSGGYVWWESLNGKADSLGIYYPYTSPIFSSLTEITTFIN